MVSPRTPRPPRSARRLLAAASAGALLFTGVAAHATDNLHPSRVLGLSFAPAIGFPDGWIDGGSWAYPYIAPGGAIIATDVVASPDTTPDNPLLYATIYHWAPGASTPTLLAADEKQAPNAPENTAIFYPRAILFDDLGRVGFQCNFIENDAVPPSTAQALFFGPPDNLQIAARAGDLVPGTTDTVIEHIPGPWGMSPTGGQLVMGCRVADIFGITLHEALLSGTPGNMRIVALENQPLPNDPRAAHMTGFFSEAIASDGTAAAFASLDTLDNTGRNDSAILLISAHADITTVARSGQPVPGLPGVNWWILVDPPHIGENGHVGFVGWSDDTSVLPSERRTFVFGLPGALQTIAYPGMQAPDLPPGVQIHTVGDAQFTPDGSRLAFSARLKGEGVVNLVNDFAIFAGSPGNMHLVARRGDQAWDLPPGNTYVDIHGFSLTDSGRLVFRASFDGPDTPLLEGNLHPTGIYAEDSQHIRHLIVRSGAPLDLTPGQTVTPYIVQTGIDMLFGVASRGKNVLNASGQLLVSADLLPDLASVFLVFDVPEACPADFNASGAVGVDDLFGYLDAWFAQFNLIGPGLSADFDRNNAVTVSDLFAYLDAWFATFGQDCP